jgi:triacylglycerol lipase
MTEPRSRHLVDPELLPLVDMLPNVPLSAELLPMMRATMSAPVADPDAARIEPAQRTVPGPEGGPDVDVLVYRPETASGPLPCILHIHGGGYVAGAAAMMATTLGQMTAALGCACVSVDYRLAPEHPYPAAVEDCYAALAWTVAHAEELGVDPARIGVMGESAGGGLAAALALLVRDRCEYAFAFQHLIYPMLDDRTCTSADPHPFAGEYLWTAHNNRFGWAALLGEAPGGPDISPYASPARAESLAGLPATFIATGALDLFAEENLEYARRLLRAGVSVELHVFPGAIHGFDMAPNIAISGAAHRIRMDSLRRQLGQPS